MIESSNKNVEEMKIYLMEQINVSPSIGIVCGSGLGEIVNILTNQIIIPFSDIPNLQVPTAPSHQGRFVFGISPCGKSIIVQQGRFHLYEGHNPSSISTPIRLFKLLGVDIVILTNAAGGINQCYNVGDLMIIKDHIYFPGNNKIAIESQNCDRLHSPFFSSGYIYDRELSLKLKNCAKMLKMDNVHCGIYASVGGPHYETTFEINFLLKNNCDAVGMSTSHEAICAFNFGMKVVAISLISNKCSAFEDHGNSVSGHDVINVANNCISSVVELLLKFISEF